MPAADHCNFRADFLRTVRKLGLIGLRSLRVKESRKAWSGDRETDNRVLASAVLLDRLAALPLGVTQRKTSGRSRCAVRSARWSFMCWRLVDEELLSPPLADFKPKNLVR